MDRLDPEKRPGDESKFTSDAINIFIEPRVRYYSSIFFHLSVSILFKNSIRKTIDAVCPFGKHSAIGGMKKRNITTFGKNTFIFQ